MKQMEIFEYIANYNFLGWDAGLTRNLSQITRFIVIYEHIVCLFYAFTLFAAEDKIKINITKHFFRKSLISKF